MWRLYAPPKCRRLFATLHSITSKKACILTDEWGHVIISRRSTYLKKVFAFYSIWSFTTVPTACSHTMFSTWADKSVSRRAKLFLKTRIITAKTTVFWYTTQRSLVDMSRRFRRTGCLSADVFRTSEYTRILQIKEFRMSEDIYFRMYFLQKIKPNTLNFTCAYPEKGITVLIKNLPTIFPKFEGKNPFHI